MKRIAGIIHILALFQICGDAWSQINVYTEDVSCFGKADGLIVVTVPNATDEVKYAWSDDGPSDRTRTDLGAGTYVVTITDATGCDHVEEIEIGGPSAPLTMKFAFGRDDTGPCDKFSPVIVIVTLSGGTPPYTVNGKSLSESIYEDRVEMTQFRSYAAVDDHGCAVLRKIRVFVGYNHCADDPNEIIGPSGYDTPAWIAIKDTLGYTIHYENDPQFATAPAQLVSITHDFDTEILPNSFRLRSFGFGEYVFTVPQNVSSFQKRYDITQTHNVYLDVVAGLDIQNNRAFWNMVAIDPLTGLRPVDPLTGFLPVNDSLAAGQGFVSFTVKQRSTVETQDTIAAQASIVFDQNAAILTNIWKNVVDAVAPTTVLDPLFPVVEDNEIVLSWTGEDDPEGCGIAHYELYVSRDDNPFEFLSLFEPDSLETVFNGSYGHTYRFYIIAVDHVGNREVKTSFETQAYILPSWKVEMQPLSDVYCVRDSLLVEYHTVLVDTVDILVTADSGATYQTLAAGVDTSTSPFSWEIPDTLEGTFLKVFVVASDSIAILDSSAFVQIKSLPDIHAGDDIVTCPHDLVHMIPSGGNAYFWSPRVGLNSQTSHIQSFRPDSTQVYSVKGTDVSGCTNTDSILVTVLPTYIDSVAHVMCDGDSVFVGGTYQTEEGYYTDELISVYGCDSTVVTQVIFSGPCAFPVPQVYVDQDALGMNNGTSWADAFLDLQDALEAVAYYPNVREIWIAEGTYYPSMNDRDSVYMLTDSVSVYGGFIGVEATREERTADASLVKLSGDIGVLNDSTDNVYHVLRGDVSCADCILDGMTIQFGQADFPFNQGLFGAGVLNEGKLSVRNCIIERNTAVNGGAAIYNTGVDADLVIHQCIFRLNTSGIARDILNTEGADIRFTGMNQVQN